MQQINSLLIVTVVFCFFPFTSNFAQSFCQIPGFDSQQRMPGSDLIFDFTVEKKNEPFQWHTEIGQSILGQVFSKSSNTNDSLKTPIIGACMDSLNADGTIITGNWLETSEKENNTDLSDTVANLSDFNGKFTLANLNEKVCSVRARIILSDSVGFYRELSEGGSYKTNPKPKFIQLQNLRFEDIEEKQNEGFKISGNLIAPDGSAWVNAQMRSVLKTEDKNGEEEETEILFQTRSEGRFYIQYPLIKDNIDYFELDIQVKFAVEKIKKIECSK